MKKLTLFMFMVLVLVASCTKNGDKAAAKMAQEYSAIKEKLRNQRDLVDSESAYLKWKEEAKNLRVGLLEKYKNAESTPALELCRSRLLIDLGETEQALAKLDEIISRNGKEALEAKFEKVRVLQEQQKLNESLMLFRQVEDRIKKTPDYFDVLLNFAWGLEDAGSRSQYSKKFINTPGIPREMERYLPYMYENIAAIARHRGDLPESKKILKDAIRKLNEEGKGIGSLEYTLRKTEMIGKPAPEILAKTWVNSKPLKLSRLKGKVVVIDFWATWCAPCRVVIPTLVKEYNALKNKGVMVIGYTRLYGNYRDDIQRKGKVEPEEEIRLTKDFLKRFGINYPVAIAEDTGVFDNFQIRGIPTMFFIDKDGRVADFKVGSGNEKFISDKIQYLLGS